MQASSPWTTVGSRYSSIYFTVNQLFQQIQSILGIGLINLVNGITGVTNHIVSQPDLIIKDIQINLAPCPADLDYRIVFTPVRLTVE